MLIQRFGFMLFADLPKDSPLDYKYNPSCSSPAVEDSQKNSKR
jgi:hypothetical protein